ncbi:MAG: DUF4954 family protein [Prevotella sp.]|nr:DUF4954 family protein [Prevotella sp.]
MEYRSLTLDEIEKMQQNGCWAEDWGLLTVAEDFSANNIRRTSFYGEITIGENCVLDNIGCIRNTGDGSFGENNRISVMNEAGEGNVVIHSQLTSQEAALCMLCKNGTAAYGGDDDEPRQTTIGSNTRIVNTRELTNVIIGDNCELSGASRLADCTLAGEEIFIGSDVICENAVIKTGATVLDGAKLYNCFVGEAVHIGKGFSAENSLFFANSYMDNGEACAAFCGPFSVSHHKSTLLIGAQYMFYNAGSNTNFSNHAYKIGPVHHGTMERGAKTASGAHILLPARIGAFSMVMGKVQNHPDTSSLPFSYIIADAAGTSIVPGRNFTTVGTYRDVNKWEKRDMRTTKEEIVNFDWLNPMVMGEVVRGRQLLETLMEEQGRNQSCYITDDGCTIKNHALMKGIHYYDMAIRMYLGSMVEHYGAYLPESSVGSGEWADLAGLLAPKSEIDGLVDDFGETGLGDIRERLKELHRNYEEYKWAWTYRMATDYYGLDNMTQDDADEIVKEGKAAREQWLDAIRRDAEREFALGDVDEDVLNTFLNQLK